MAKTEIVKSPEQMIEEVNNKLAERLNIPMGLEGSTDAADVVTAEILNRIAVADTIEAALAVGGLESVDNHLGETLHFVDFGYRASTFEAHKPWPYVVLLAEDVDGNGLMLGVSGKKAIVQLAIIKKKNGLPGYYAFESRQTASGYDTHGIVQRESF